VCRVERGTLACASDAVDDIWVPIPDLDRYGLSETAVTVVHRGVALCSESRLPGGVLGEPQLNFVSRAVASRVGPGERIGPRPLLG
jgi:hypothetical protein